MRNLPSYATIEPAVEPAPVSISIIVPAFNEAARICSYLLEIHAYFSGRRETHEIIVVNDGSSDRTAEVIRELMQRIPALRLITYSQNHGKGHAVRLGMLEARGSFRAFADADGSTPISEIEKLRVRIQHDCFDIAIGSRALSRKNASLRMSVARRVIAHAFRGIRDLILDLSVEDSQCGFKLFSAAAAIHVFQTAKCDGLAFDVEALHIARRAGLRFVEVPVRWADSKSSRICWWRDPIAMTLDLLRIRRQHRVQGSQFAGHEQAAIQK